MTNRAPNEFVGTFYHAAKKHAGVTKREAELRNMTWGDKTP